MIVRCMSAKRPSAPLITLSLATCLIVGWPASSNAGVRPNNNHRVSVASNGTQANARSGGGAGNFGSISMTPDGRYVAFSSQASNLAPNDTNGFYDVFVHDRATGETNVVSVNSTGIIGDLASSNPSISDNGRFVAFQSEATNLVPLGDTAVLRRAGVHIYVHDTFTGRTTLVSVNSKGEESNGSSFYPTISANGRYVAFQSRATNLDPKVCPADLVEQVKCLVNASFGFDYTQAYVHDRVTRTTAVVSVSSNGTLADAGSYYPAINASGRYIEFMTAADNLDPNDVNQCPQSFTIEFTSPAPRPSCPDIFLHDVKLGKTELVSVGMDGGPADGASFTGDIGTSFANTISADGRYVLFGSFADNLVPNRGKHHPGLYLRDRKTAKTEMVWADSTGQPLNWFRAATVGLSREGRYVVAEFYDSGSLLVPSPCATLQLAFHDRMTGATEHYPRTKDQACGEGYNVAVSENGRYMAFASNTPDLVRDDTNNAPDVFVTDRGAELGVGGLLENGELSVPGSRTFATTGIASSSDATNDLNGALSALGANLYGASIAYRPQYADLFATLELEEMPKVLSSDISPILYGLRLTVAGTSYEVRAVSLLGGTFGLFDCTDPLSACTKIADLKGGYGTTGERVVLSLPLDLIGLQSGGNLSNVQTFTAIGTYATGITKILDTAKISNR